MRQSLPEGWSEERIQRLLREYETQSDDDAMAEDEAAWEDISETTMKVPVDLVPAVLEMIRKRDTE
jgi:hypothetical protein